MGIALGEYVKIFKSFTGVTVSSFAPTLTPTARLVFYRQPVSGS